MKKMCGTFHWTAGTYEPNDLERSDYHLLIVYDPKTKKVHTEKHNNYTDKLGHTWNRNTGNVGISLCGMAAPSDWHNFGKYPILYIQLIEACIAAAEVCLLKDLKPEDWKTHAEWAVLDGYGPFSGDPETRWDLALFKPAKYWDREQAEKDVITQGEWLRGKIRFYMSQVKTPRGFHMKDCNAERR